jgi:pimeloyl-ACP methyl ester carboxylesterase
VWAQIADMLAAGDFGQVVLSGHSQGAGHAVFMARDFAAERLVILAGPADRLGDGTAGHAPVPWIVGLGGATPPQTPVASFYTFLHLDDSVEVVAQVEDNWDTMGISVQPCVFSEAAAYPATCRRVLIPADGCTGLAAHTTVVVRRWGAACALGQAGHTTAATWQFLLNN